MAKELFEPRIGERSYQVEETEAPLLYEDGLEVYCQEKGIKLDDKQKELAVHFLQNQKVSRFVGAGTGKSFLFKVLEEFLHYLERRLKEKLDKNDAERAAKEVPVEPRPGGKVGTFDPKGGTLGPGGTSKLPVIPPKPAEEGDKK